MQLKRFFMERNGKYYTCTAVTETEARLIFTTFMPLTGYAKTAKIVEGVPGKDEKQKV